MKALLIEDDKDTRDIVAGHLRCYGASEVVESDNFSGAMEIVAKNSFDVICVDLRLSDSSAKNTLARLPILASFSGDAVIVVVTGNASVPINATTCADSVLYKPFSYLHFKSALDSAFKKASKPETKRGLFASLEMLLLRTA